MFRIYKAFLKKFENLLQIGFSRRIREKIITKAVAEEHQCTNYNSDFMK